MANAKDTNNATNSAANIEALMAQLAEARANASGEALELINQGIVALNSNLTQDERNKARAKEKADKLAEKNAKAAKVHLALTAWMREIGDDISLVVRFERYKAPTGEWRWKLQGLSGETGEQWLPSGKSLKFTYHNPTGQTAHYLNWYESDSKHPRGAKRATGQLLKGLGIWKDEEKAGSTATTILRRELDKTDSDGNPAGQSQFRTQLEAVEISHEDINGGKPQKLIEYYLEFLADEDEAEDEGGEDKE